MTGRGYDLVAAGTGVLFIVLGGAYLLDALDVWDAEARVVLPLLVIGLGLALLFGALTRKDEEA